ncbi:MAG: ribosome recycling factor [Acidobacteria bacterium]|nr:ribosome recycling factor [Acidobacteriota bacterium]
MLNEVYKETKAKMASTLDVIEKKLATIRTGKASISMLDGVKVSAYGSEMPLNQVGTLTAPEPALLVVQPWDVSIVSEIEKGILKADLGLNPMNDGKVIRIPIPPLSEERRSEMAKKINQIGEEGKTSIRNIRRDSNDTIKKLQKDKDITEDDEHRGLDEVQKITDDYIKQIDERVENKQKEIMTV